MINDSNTESSPDVPARFFALQTFVVLLVATVLLTSGCNQTTELEALKQEGFLHVITRNGPTTYFEDRDGPAGFDFELTQMFAEHLGVKLKIRVAGDAREAFDVLHQNYTHLAALGLSQHAVAANTEKLKFSTEYKATQPMVLFKNGNKKPNSIEDLLGQSIAVEAHTAQVNQLNQIKHSRFAGLAWQEIEEIDTPELMRMVVDGEVDITIVNSVEYDVHKAIFPTARKAFPLSEPLKISWIFPAGEDSTIIDEANKFIKSAKSDGRLLYLQEKYYGHVNQLGYVGAKTFIKHIKERLPKFASAFKAASKNTDVEWQLLAAIGYQESHWRPRAISPTGVRGLMMLTRVTAKEMGIENRLDPVQSINGGAAYFSSIRQRIPEQIPEPDRTWLALASYNVGFGHLQDARTITRQQGYDSNKWVDVKKHLPLLEKKKWYSKTRHGYARGNEPVTYVQNIRRYYDVLAWMTQPDRTSARFSQLKKAGKENHSEIKRYDPTMTAPFKATPPML